MPTPPSTRLAYIVLAVQIDERISNAMAHDLALRSVDRCIEDANREFHCELEDMTVLDELNFASVSLKADARHHGLLRPSNSGQAPPGVGENSAKSGYAEATVAGGTLAELSPNESQKDQSNEVSYVAPNGRTDSLHTKSTPEHIAASNLAELDSERVAVTEPCAPENLNNSPCPAMDGCLENGKARLGTHNAEQPGKAVSDALADGLNLDTTGKSHPLQSERCTTSQEAPEVGRAPRQLLEDAA